MEACRPGSDDLSDLGLAFLADQLASDPGLQRQYRRLQRLDQSLADAYQDVPVPEGLEDRILGQLAEARPETSLPVTASIEPAPVTPAAAPLGVGRRVSRPWLSAGVSLVAAACVLVLVAIQAVEDKPFDGLDLAPLAIDSRAADAVGTGQSIAEAPPPAGYPLSEDVRQASQIQWRWVRDFVGHKAIAYDILSPNGTAATLYVIRGMATGLPAAPSPQPFVTQGVSASAWQADHLVYVLVVEGDERAYRQFILAQREPLT